MGENVTLMTVLEELREFRVENNKRWEENDKRWEQNEKRWEQNNKKIDSLDERVSRLEEGRIKDRRDIINILDSMQKSIDSQFKDMRNYMDTQFMKINAANMVNDIEHAEFRQLLKAYAKRIDFQNSRITSLEEWKSKISDDGLYAYNT